MPKEQGRATSHAEHAERLGYWVEFKRLWAAVVRNEQPKRLSDGADAYFGGMAERIDPQVAKVLRLARVRTRWSVIGQ